MKKLSLTLLFTFLLVGILATSTLANNTPNPIGGFNADLTPADGDAAVKNNANASGIGNTFDAIIKSTDMFELNGTVGDHKTHTSYKSNTNSCASCHQTHNASARQLIFANTVYETCAACHDGTLGFYNVFESDGEEYVNSASTAGTFGGSHAGMSVHMVNNTVKNSAAPGGKGVPSGAGWGSDFSCASCHSPHGSYSDRLLHYNPNGMGQVGPEEGGIAALNVPVRNWANRTSSGWELRRGTPAELGMTGEFAAGTVAVRLYNNGALDTTPWLYGYSGNPRDYHAQLLTGTGTRINYQSAGIYVNHEKGYMYSTTDAGATLLGQATVGNISRAYVVKLQFFQDYVNPISEVVTKHNVATLWNGQTKGTTNATNGPRMSAFCSSCHTDYLTQASRGTSDKKWNNNVGHTTTSANYTCVRCHFAHGTDVELMVDAQSKTIFDLMDEHQGLSKTDAIAYMTDKNPSSALKKYTNMSGCWACHNSSKATQIKNNDKRENAPSGMIQDLSQREIKEPDPDPNPVIATGRVTHSTSVNVRSQPLSGSTYVIGTIDPNTIVNIYDESDTNYYKIMYNDVFAYILKSTVTKQ